MVIRAYSNHLHTDCAVRVHVKSANESYFSVPKRFKLVFNNYKNYFLTERMPRVPLHNDYDTDLDVDEDSSDNTKYTLVDSVGKQLVSLNERTGEISLKPLLNSNNYINASFDIEISGISFYFQFNFLI